MDLQNASKSSALFSPGVCQFPQEDTSAIAVYRADQTHKHILVKRVVILWRTLLLLVIRLLLFIITYYNIIIIIIYYYLL